MTDPTAQDLDNATARDAISARMEAEYYPGMKVAH
jgi:hypothetical protein